MAILARLSHILLAYVLVKVVCNAVLEIVAYFDEVARAQHSLESVSEEYVGFGNDLLEVLV